MLYPYPWEMAIKVPFKPSFLLQMATGKHMNKTWEASSLTSPDGETVALTANLIIEGAVELWLVGLEKAMQIALQKLLACSLQAYK